MRMKLKPRQTPPRQRGASEPGADSCSSGRGGLHTDKNVNENKERGKGPMKKRRKQEMSKKKYPKCTYDV